jgi:Tfp pilus assembly protein PilX
MALVKDILQNRRGAVLIISMIFVLIFSALAVSMATMSGTNVQLASNQRKLNSTLSAAHSGLEAMRYWMDRITIPDSTSPSDYLSTVFSSFQNDLAANSITNISASYSSSTITIPPVILASVYNINFEATIL